MGIRRKSRELVVQTLYALEYKKDFHYDDFHECLKDIMTDNNLDPDGKIYEFAASLLGLLFNNLPDVDELIRKHSTNWDLDRLAILDKGILRFAVAEMKYTQTAPPIIMNEAIEISKRFSSENSGRFINGVLNSIAEELKAKKNV